MVFRVAVFLLALAAWTLPATAQCQASAALQARHAELDKAMTRATSNAGKKRVVRLLDDSVDYDAIIHRVLVSHWRGLSAEQRKEAGDLLRIAIRQRYKANLEALQGWHVSVVDEDQKGIGMQVRTEARRGKKTARIDYDMLETAKGWRIVNFISEGNSLVHQYRTQFNRIIRREGWSGFIGRLRKHVRKSGVQH